MKSALLLLPTLHDSPKQCLNKRHETPTLVPAPFLDIAHAHTEAFAGKLSTGKGVVATIQTSLLNSTTAREQS